MPQMMPINWIISFLFIIIMYLIFNIMNYFIFNIKPKNTFYNMNNKKTNLYWKW
uniref:ATP synthase complex subunit 8 n=1 Tax=Epicopeia hainesii TaxID=691109 RepID=A0A5Q0U1W6_9NEOP|nr:ATP synthase F0 subunit 8 [Epicopeia hainesii]QGA74569.1 ATP synthase F0 subunit 8 [Epicopeia hainesii]